MLPRPRAAEGLRTQARQVHHTGRPIVPSVTSKTDRSRRKSRSASSLISTRATVSDAACQAGDINPFSGSPPIDPQPRSTNRCRQAAAAGLAIACPRHSALGALAPRQETGAQSGNVSFQRVRDSKEASRPLTQFQAAKARQRSAFACR